MNILPPGTARRIGDPLTTAMSRLDGCPRCVHNTEMPTAAIPRGNGWQCHYKCADCGHSWTACWAVD